MSTPPVLGRKLRIGRRNGSVSARNRFQTERTRSLRMFTTPKAISQERIAPSDDDPGVKIEDHHHDVEDGAHECLLTLPGRLSLAEARAGPEPRNR